MENFEKLLGIDNPILQVITERGFENPSEIQELAIPKVLEGKDIIAGASTGSGKTLAFAAGLIKNAKKDFGVQGFVITPTRELADQITRELSDFSKHKKLKITSVYGGVSIYNQVKNIESAEIVVGTPGRILDHLKRGTIDLSKVNTLVLDEADRMFDMGFRDDVQSIINHCPKKRQTLLFSATISSEVIKLANKYLENPIEISAKAHVDASKLKQIYYDIEDGLKYSLLKHLVENEKSKLSMIFCNTRKNVDFVSKNLKFMGLNAIPLHGGFSQDKRNRFIEMFQKGKADILVATDVAARGLDIQGITHIYNYDIPINKEEYIHRIGRTARAGKEGKVINILTGRHYDNFQDIFQSKEFNIESKTAPEVSRVRIRWMPEKREERNRRRSDMGRERDSNSWKKRNNSRGDRGNSWNNRSDSRGSYGRNNNRGNSWNNNRDDSRGSYTRSNSQGDNKRSYGRGNSGGDNRGSYGRSDSRGENRGSYGRSDSRGSRGDNRGSYGRSDSRGSRGDNRGSYGRDNSGGNSWKGRNDSKGNRNENSNDRRNNRRENNSDRGNSYSKNKYSKNKNFKKKITN